MASEKSGDGAVQPASPPYGGVDAIWERVQETPPQYTKAMSGSFHGTSIAPAYMVKRATEVFGPLGIGWGYEIVEEKFEQGAPLGLNSNGDSLGNAVVHILRLKFWYELNGKTGSFEQFGQTPFVGLNADHSRVVTDSDVKKKSLTDALTKCLSLLGFGGDVYLGLYDDDKYFASVVSKYGAPAVEPSSTSSGEAGPRSDASKQASGSRPEGAPRTRRSRSQGEASASSPAAPAPPATSDGQSDSSVTGSQGDLGLDPPRHPSDTANPASAPAPTNVDAWLRRAKTMGSEAIEMARSTVKSLFQGDDLGRIEQALDDREKVLKASTT